MKGSTTMKYLSCIFITFIASSLLLVTGCSESGTGFEENESYQVKNPNKTITLTGIEATTRMIEVLESDLTDNPNTRLTMTTTVGDKTVTHTRRELLENFKKNLHSLKNVDTAKTSQSAECMRCTSTIQFIGYDPPGQREVHFMTVTDLNYMDDISHNQNMKMYVVDGGYSIFDKSLYYPGGWGYTLYSETYYPFSGDSVRAILNSVHRAYWLEPNPESFASRKG